VFAGCVGFGEDGVDRLYPEELHDRKYLTAMRFKSLRFMKSYEIGTGFLREASKL